MPILVICGLAVAVLNWIFSSEDKKTKSETAPDTETECRRKDAETAVFRSIPAESRVKPAAVPSVPKVPAPASVPAAVASPKIVRQVPPPPIKKKFVTREDMAAIFQNGARALTRPEAVAALKKLGFSKSAAYAALTPDGRFSAWLQFAPDGVITWTE